MRVVKSKAQNRTIPVCTTQDTRGPMERQTGCSRLADQGEKSSQRRRICITFG